MARYPAAKLGGYCRTMGNPLARKNPTWSLPDGLQSQKSHGPGDQSVLLAVSSLKGNVRERKNSNFRAAAAVKLFQLARPETHSCG